MERRAFDASIRQRQVEDAARYAAAYQQCWTRRALACEILKACGRRVIWLERV